LLLQCANNLFGVMGIHLAAEGLKVEGFFGCHSNPKYTVIAALSGLRLIGWYSGLAQTGMQVGNQGGHLLVGKPAGKSRHHPLARERHALKFPIAGRCAAGKSTLRENSMQIRGDLLEVQVVVLVAMSTANLVEVLTFRLLWGE
jgi:hypothetical protein